MENQSVEQGQLVYMELREDELAWAYQIKAAINHSPNLKNISDYECAEWAIVTLARQDVDEVLDRAYKMQCFLEEHKILHSQGVKSFAVEGLDIIKGFMKLMPGYLLSVDYLPSQGHYLLILDCSVFESSNLKNEQDWKFLLGGWYFLFSVMNSNLSVIRSGIAAMIECMDMQYPHASAVERQATDIWGYFPYKLKQSMWLNAPTATSIAISIMKPFLPEDIKNAIELGTKIHGYDGKIDQLFHTPSLEANQNAVLEKIERYLAERQYNQSTYKLPPPPVNTAS